MKISRKMLPVLLIAALLLATLGVGGTAAYFNHQTDTQRTCFTFAGVDTQLAETFDGRAQSGIAVRNAGVPVYVRVAVIGSWVDKGGRIVAPWSGSVAHNAADWAYQDGFYYARAILQEGGVTPNLLASPITEEGKPDGADHLVLTVLHQSVQAAGVNAEGTLAVTDAWSWIPPASGEVQP